jgi:2-succinyl-5-enolpyruvyl-6-hydroxy-3-cyclohexene-1-carboxylate synthase
MAVPNLDFRNTNSLWGSVLVEVLFRGGVRQAVVAPGSRSAPLAFALARHPGIEAIPALDERSAAFFALGLAKQSGAPVALACTSGTATANFLPAVVEAWHSGVPLIVLTADRPPELQGCSSPQTIDQRKLYGTHVNLFQELPVPAATLSALRALRQAVVRAVRASHRPSRGPVHLNLPFRDPLPPIADGRTGTVRRRLQGERFFAGLGFPLAAAPVRGDLSGLPGGRRVVVVAGPDDAPLSSGEFALLGDTARAHGWPVLADALSGLRGHADQLPGLVAHYDTILRNPRLARQLAPEAVLCLGGWPTSKVLRAWLQEHAPAVWLVSTSGHNRDALQLATTQVRGRLGQVVKSLAPAAAGAAYLDRWTQAEQRASARIDTVLRRGTEGFEPRAAWRLAQHLPAGTPVFLASSMPVRDAEYFWPANDRGLVPYYNRGANGIDGTLSTALGVAHGGRPAVLLTGDLAFLHDSNGLLLRPKFRGSLTIVLVNNHGGGIFEHLPVAQFPEAFEEFFATPQQADFGRLCAAHGVPHTVVRSWSAFTRLVARLPRRGLRVLELRTDRRRDAAARKALFASVSAGL